MDSCLRDNQSIPTTGFEYTWIYIDGRYWPVLVVCEGKGVSGEMIKEGKGRLQFTR